jgi:hypothetical protein
MRRALGLFLLGLMAFLLVAGETPATLLSRIMVLFNGPQYARSVFADRVPFDRVLASDTRTAADPDGRSCWVAVVELAADAPQKPPKIPLIDQDSARFGGNWRATPVTGGPPLDAGLIEACGSRLDSISRQKLWTSLEEPGAFVIRDWKNDVLQIYAPRVGLAAHLSYK